MNRLGIEERIAIVRALAEGNSVTATARLTGAAKATVLKLMVEIGEFCSIYQHRAHRSLAVKRIEADEIWTFVGARGGNAKSSSPFGIWTYTAVDADSKLLISWLVGERNNANAFAFMRDVALRLAIRRQITTQGLPWYAGAAVGALSWNGVDFAQLVRKYAEGGNPSAGSVGHYSRLANAFSKKAENHVRAVSLYFMIYNYCRQHQALTKAANGIKTTPAMAAHLTDHVWPIEEVLEKMNPIYLLQST